MMKNQTIDNRKSINRSGFFVFNEEDMKSMTEMSPKQSTSNTRQRSLINVTKSIQFEYPLRGGVVGSKQLNLHQKPSVKSDNP
jgi:hypothetical protein